MGDKTAIEWTDATWNPIRGMKGLWSCVKVSEGCQNCYAERLNLRFGGPEYKHGADMLRLDAEALTQPLRWRRPRRIFVCSMTDLFEERVLDKWVARIFDMMTQCNGRYADSPSRHIFQVLTKRPERMCKFMEKFTAARGTDWLGDHGGRIWLGVSVENQARADERIPWLLRTPAAVRFLSVEPLIGPVDLSRWLLPSKVCQNCDCEFPLDSQMRQQRHQEGYDIPSAMNLPPRHRLPAALQDSSPVPPNLTAKRVGQPPHDSGVGIVDSQAGAVRTEGVPSPVKVSFSIKKGSNVADDKGICRDADALGQQDTTAGTPSRNASISDRTPDRSLPDPKFGGDTAKRVTVNVGSDNPLSCVCRCHSLHTPHCTIDWCIVGGESGGPPERSLVRRDTRPRPGELRFGPWKPKPEALEWVRNLRDQCVAAGVPYFFKQWGGPTPKSGGRLLDGREWSEMPTGQKGA